MERRVFRAKAPGTMSFSVEVHKSGKVQCKHV